MNRFFERSRQNLLKSYEKFKGPSETNTIPGSAIKVSDCYSEDKMGRLDTKYNMR